MKLFEASRNSSRCMMSPTNSERGPLVALYKRAVNCNGSVGYPSALKRLCRICSRISIHRGARLATSVPSLALVSYHCLQSAIGSAARLRFFSLTSELSFLLINLALSGILCKSHCVRKAYYTRLGARFVIRIYGLSAYTFLWSGYEYGSSKGL